MSALTLRYAENTGPRWSATEVIACLRSWAWAMPETPLARILQRTALLRSPPSGPRKHALRRRSGASRRYVRRWRRLRGPAALSSGSPAGAGLVYTGAKAKFNPRKSWHLYRVEADGNKIKLLIDGAVIAEGVDNTYLSGGQVGLWSNEVQLNVRSSKVLRAAVI